MVTDLLTEHFQVGNNKDYVKMTDVKYVLRNGGMKFANLHSVKKTVEEIFDGVEFKGDTTVNCERCRRVFVGLKPRYIRAFTACNTV